MSPTQKTKWYRYEDRRVCSIAYGGDAEWNNSYCEIYLHEYEVLKETPKGVWINRYGTPRFVLLNARKRFACPSKEEAKQSFLARKQAHLRHLNRKIANVNEAIDKMQWHRD